MNLNKEIFFIALFLLVFTLTGIAFGYDMFSSTYSIDYIHYGSSGNNGSSATYLARNTVTYEQGGNDNGSSDSYDLNLGWFNVTYTFVVSGEATINSVQCSNDSVNFYDCDEMAYGMNITHIRTNCTSPVGIASVRFDLFNLPDNVSYIDNESYTYQQDDFFIYNSSYTLEDSGDWNLTIYCTSNTSQQDTNLTGWSLPWGYLNISLVQPTTNFFVKIFEYFTFQSKAICVGGECGRVNVTLDPEDCVEITVCKNETVEECTEVPEEVCSEQCSEDCDSSIVETSDTRINDVCMEDCELNCDICDENETECDCMSVCQDECTQDPVEDCIEQEACDNCTTTCSDVCEYTTKEVCEDVEKQTCEDKLSCTTWDFFALEDEYELGDEVEFFVLPAGSEFEINITKPDGSEDIIDDITYLPDMSGEYLAEALVMLGNKSMEFEYEFKVRAEEGTTFIEGEDIEVEDKFVGEKITDELDFETHFVSMEQGEEYFTAVFYHDHDGVLPVYVKGDVEYELSAEEADGFENVTLKVELVNGILPMFELHIGETSEVFQFGKSIPKVEIKEGSYRLVDRNDKKIDVVLEKDDVAIKLYGVGEGQVKASAGLGDGNETTTSIAAVQTIDIEEAEITLDKKGDVNSILYCDDENFDYDTLSCSEWKNAGLQFNEDSDTVTFTVKHFTAYAGGDLDANETSYLTVWDDNDVGMSNTTTRILGENFHFFADYKLSSNGTVIDDATCTINFSDSHNGNMVYNATTTYYDYNRTFGSAGLYTYTVSCTHLNYTDLSTGDEVSVPSAVQKTGMVSTTVGNTPFYTINANPDTCSNSWLRAGDQCLSSWTVNATGILDTVHTFYTIYNMTTNKDYVSDNESVHINITIAANDTVLPTIIYQKDIAGSVAQDTNIDLFFTVSDDVQVDECWANITLPDLSGAAVYDVCDELKNYNVTQLGNYSVKFIVNDTDGNVATGTDTFEVSELVVFTFYLNQSNETLSGDTIFTNTFTGETIDTKSLIGQATVNLPDVIFNMQFSAFSDDIIMIIRYINITEDNEKAVWLDKLDTAISGYLYTYGADTSFNYTNLTLRFVYGSVPSESDLELWKCDDWLFNNQTCNSTWSEITSQASQNTANDYFEYFTTSLSGFSIKQGSYCGDSTCDSGEDCSSCESDCGACPSNGGGTGGGGGSSRTGCFWEWECTEWNVCADGKQTRECENTGHCPDSIRPPALEQECEVEPEEPTMPEVPILPEENEITGKVVKEVVAREKGILGTTLEGVVNAFKGAVQGAGNAMGAIGNVFKAIITGIGKVLGTIWPGGGNLFQNVKQLEILGPGVFVLSYIVLLAVSVIFIRYVFQKTK